MRGGSEKRIFERPRYSGSDSYRIRVKEMDFRV